MLHRLRQEHKHINVLLKVLEEKIDALILGDQVNYKLIRDVVEYMQGYAENCHHPLEDIIYDYYLHKCQDTANTSRLIEEHQQLVITSEQLINTVNLILTDIVIPKEKLINQMSDYVKFQREHITYEERDIFPLLDKLSADDWRAIVIQCRQQPDFDPMLSHVDSPPHTVKVAAGNVTLSKKRKDNYFQH